MTSTCHNMTILEPGHECRAGSGWAEILDIGVYVPANGAGTRCCVCVCVFASTLQTFTFVYRDDVRVAEGRHDLDLSADVHHVMLILDLLLPN